MKITSTQLKQLIIEELSTLLSETQIDPTTQEMMNAVKGIGFNNIEFISSGQYGSVFRGTWDQHDGVERAIKVIIALSTPSC